MKTFVLQFIFNKTAGFMQPYKKKTPTQVFSCKYCEIFKENVFYKTLPVAASVIRAAEIVECVRK